LGDARLRARLRIRDEQDTVHEVGEDQAVRNREDGRTVDDHEIRSTALLEHLAHPIGLQELDGLVDGGDRPAGQDVEVREVRLDDRLVEREGSFQDLT